MPMTAIYRRNFITGAAISALGWSSTGWAAVPETRDLRFSVFRKGSNIGTHSVSFEPAGEALTVRVAVDMAVKFGPVTVYRYTLRGTEQWQRGVLMSATSDTVDGGDKAWLRAARQDGKLRVEGSAGKPYVAPEGSIIASHWNPDELRAPMVNLQNGELLDFTVTPAGTQTVRASGRDVAARQYALTGPAVLNLWYDPANIWTKLRAIGTDGSEISYERG
jgi:hypothetical protein